MFDHCIDLGLINQTKRLFINQLILACSGRIIILRLGNCLKCLGVMVSTHRSSQDSIIPLQPKRCDIIFIWWRSAFQTCPIVTLVQFYFLYIVVCNWKHAVFCLHSNVYSIISVYFQNFSNFGCLEMNEIQMYRNGLSVWQSLVK